MNKKHAKHKSERATSEIKMKHMTGTSKNYCHPSDKAERLCNGGYAKGGPVLDPDKLCTTDKGFYGRDNMKINMVKGDE